MRELTQAELDLVAGGDAVQPVRQPINAGPERRLPINAGPERRLPINAGGGSGSGSGSP